LAGAIVAGVADPSFKVRLTLGVDANPLTPVPVSRYVWIPVIPRYRPVIPGG
jgi:hypothetical protein